MKKTLTIVSMLCFSVVFAQAQTTGKKTPPPTPPAHPLLIIPPAPPEPSHPLLKIKPPAVKEVKHAKPPEARKPPIPPAKKLKEITLF